MNNYRDKAYEIAKSNGFHDEEHSVEHYKCLIISELMEAVEADRKGYRADWEAYEKYDCRISFAENFERHIKDTVEDELADACIRIFDLAGAKHIDITPPFEGYHINPKQCDMLTEHIYNICKVLTFEGMHLSKSRESLFRHSLIYAIEYLKFIADDVIGFELFKHVELKMAYNETRQRLHGKRY